METLKAVPGTYDIFPEDARTWDRVRRIVAHAMRAYAYGRVETPHMESAELFARGVGTDTDIVQKEMYVFEDRGGRQLALRPEGTAGVVRAYIEARLDKQRPYSKLWYWGPMFRAERPQKGRYRQFWQFGVEAIGIAGPTIDAEQIALAMFIAGKLQLENLVLRLSSIGDGSCRPAYRERLVSYLQGVQAKLCDPCRRRVRSNPMRVLDCKEAGCRAATADAPLVIDYLCDPCREHLDGVRSSLDRFGVDYVLDGRIVRGLDYYRRTAFELESGRLGAQNSIVGGGRYDGLVAALGGPDVPGVGWAAGVERFLLAADSVAGDPALDAFIAGFPDTRGAAAELAQRWRHSGLRVEIDYLDRSLKAQLKEAARQGARFAVVVGPDEWSQGQVMLRDLNAGTQEAVTPDEAHARVSQT